MIDFQKLAIITKREYLTRVRSKAFIIVTLLVPVGIIIILGAPVLFQMMDSDQTYTIVLKDDSGIVSSKMIQIDSTHYSEAGTASVEELRQKVIDKSIEGFIVISEEDLQNSTSFEMVYGGGGGVSLVSNVEDDLETAIREARLGKAEASEEILTILDSNPELTTRKLTEEGQEEASNSFFFLFLGYAMAFIIYGAIFGYGGYVMRGVAEEKTNRIVEIVVSSVKPFELLLGKILGIGALGITQFLVWMLAGAGLLALGGPIAAMFLSSETSSAAAAEQVPFVIPDVGIEVGIYFIVFFILGYLLYSSIMAALGSAVDSESDTQQLMFPVTIPVIIAIILLPRVATDPDSTLSVVSSLIPLFSPVLMVARIPVTDVPFWEISLAIFLMILTAAGSLYLGAKIYRVGILSYGKTANFKELWKWVKQG